MSKNLLHIVCFRLFGVVEKDKNRGLAPLSLGHVAA